MPDPVMFSRARREIWPADLIFRGPEGLIMNSKCPLRETSANTPKAHRIYNQAKARMCNQLFYKQISAIGTNIKDRKV